MSTPFFKFVPKKIHSFLNRNSFVFYIIILHKKRPPIFSMVSSAILRMTGLEPARAQCPLEPESSASASSATSAHLSALDYNTAPKHFCQHIFYIFYIFFIFLFYRNSGTKSGTRSVHTMPFTKASTAIVPFVFLLIMPKVVSIEVAPAGAMAE